MGDPDFDWEILSEVVQFKPGSKDKKDLDEAVTWFRSKSQLLNVLARGREQGVYFLCELIFI